LLFDEFYCTRKLLSCRLIDLGISLTPFLFMSA
jgi:hypothetical protein